LGVAKGGDSLKTTKRGQREKPKKPQSKEGKFLALKERPVERGVWKTTYTGKKPGVSCKREKTKSKGDHEGKKEHEGEGSSEGRAEGKYPA